MAHIMGMSMQIGAMKIGIEEDMADAVAAALNTAMDDPVRCDGCGSDANGTEFYNLSASTSPRRWHRRVFGRWMATSRRLPANRPTWKPAAESCRRLKHG